MNTAEPTGSGGSLLAQELAERYGDTITGLTIYVDAAACTTPVSEYVEDVPGIWVCPRCHGKTER